MRSLKTALLATTAVILFGCSAADKEIGVERNALLNASLIESLQRTQIDNAIIRQQAMFPYHFVAHSAELNGLGRRDALILARHYASHPGKLYLHAGDADDRLYERRAEALRDFLAGNGVDPQRIEISGDAMPGGNGADAARVLFILEAERAGARAGASNPGDGLGAGAVVEQGREF